VSSFKAWTQDPEDWKITFPQKQKKRKKTLIELLTPWLIAIALILYISLSNALIELI